MRLRSSLAVFAVAALMLVLPACAAKGARNRTQVASLTVGEAALAISQAEYEVYSAGIGGYDKAQHDTVGAAVLKVLYASRAFERAAAAYPTSGPAPQQIDQAKAGLVKAVDDLQAAIPAIDKVREPLFRAINVLRAALASSSARLELPPANQAQEIPAGGVQVLFALGAMAIGLYQKIREALKQSGATPEQLAELDAQLTDAIAKREAELKD